MKLTHPTKYFAVPALVLLGLCMAVTAFANPFYTGTKAKSAVATTTLAYQGVTPGTATSTTVYDSYEQLGTNQTNGGNITLPNTVAVAVQGAASSTATIVSVTCEFSDDNVDWYQNEIYNATTSIAQTITNPISFQFTYASTTVGGAIATTTYNRFQKVFLCPVPLRYVRAVVTVLGANAGTWTAIIPTKQRN